MATSRLVVHCLRQVRAAELVQAAAAVASPPVKYLSAYGPTVAAINEVLPASNVDSLMDDVCRLGNEYVLSFLRKSSFSSGRFCVFQ